jgi:surface antigen
MPSSQPPECQGAYCREFQQTVSIGGREERAYGTACRQPDGSWKVVS